ncbi:MAG: ABC transporter permease [Desulfarculaceae bacterium]|nr:ABC transporter permease [Desulfarculaceae bacterium]
MSRRFALARPLHLLLVLWLISLGSFALFAMAPGDPAEIILRDRHEAPSQEQIQALRSQMGLDRSWPVRYGLWMGRVLQGDLGRSWRSGETVAMEIARRLPATLELALASLVVVLLLSSLSGSLAALKQGRALDRGIRAWTVLLISLPNYWLGLLLIYFLSLKAHWLPVMGRGGLEHLVLPCLTLGASVAMLQGRVLRATLLQIMGMDYIRFAHAKGLRPSEVFWRHMFKNALPPLVTMWGVSLGQLLGGAMIVETIFAWPGLGQLTVQAVLGRDVPVVQGIILLVAAAFVVINQAVDWINRRLDPRMGAHV